MFEAPTPWFVAGPAIGVITVLLLLVGNRPFGNSSNFRHLCAAVSPVRPPFLQYDWKRAGLWNLTFLLGIGLGGALGAVGSPDAGAHVAEATRRALQEIGVHTLHGLVPDQIFSWEALASARGLVLLVGGGVLVGFGTAYAGGCTSGHGITGLADRQLPSLVAVLGFFAGGLAGTYFLLPWALRLP